MTVGIEQSWQGFKAWFFREDETRANKARSGFEQVQTLASQYAVASVFVGVSDKYLNLTKPELCGKTSGWGIVASAAATLALNPHAFVSELNSLEKIEHLGIGLLGGMIGGAVLAQGYQAIATAVGWRNPVVNLLVSSYLMHAGNALAGYLGDHNGWKLADNLLGKSAFWGTVAMAGFSLGYLGVAKLSWLKHLPVASSLAAMSIGGTLEFGARLAGRGLQSATGLDLAAGGPLPSSWRGLGEDFTSSLGTTVHSLAVFHMGNRVGEGGIALAKPAARYVYAAGRNAWPEMKKSAVEIYDTTSDALIGAGRAIRRHIPVQMIQRSDGSIQLVFGRHDPTPPWQLSVPTDSDGGPAAPKDTGGRAEVHFQERMRRCGVLRDTGWPRNIVQLIEERYMNTLEGPQWRRLGNILTTISERPSLSILDTYPLLERHSPLTVDQLLLDLYTYEMRVDPPAAARANTGPKDMEILGIPRAAWQANHMYRETCSRTLETYRQDLLALLNTKLPQYSRARTGTSIRHQTVQASLVTALEHMPLMPLAALRFLQNRFGETLPLYLLTNESLLLCDEYAAPVLQAILSDVPPYERLRINHCGLPFDPNRQRFGGSLVNPIIDMHTGETTSLLASAVRWSVLAQLTRRIFRGTVLNPNSMRDWKDSFILPNGEYPIHVEAINRDSKVIVETMMGGLTPDSILSPEYLAQRLERLTELSELVRAKRANAIMLVAGGHLPASIQTEMREMVRLVVGRDALAIQILPLEDCLGTPLPQSS